MDPNQEIQKLRQQNAQLKQLVIEERNKNQMLEKKQLEIMKNFFIFSFEPTPFCSTAVGIRCKDGVVLGVEKLILSKLLEEGSNRRIFTSDRHIGMVTTRLIKMKLEVKIQKKNQHTRPLLAYLQMPVL